MKASQSHKALPYGEFILAAMNAPVESSAYPGATADLRHDDIAGDWKANGRARKQGCSERRWFRATVPPIDFRRDELERTHWHKVWRSMFED